MSDAFWLNNPSILIDKDHFMKIWPSKNLSYAAQLNALTRLIIISSILGYFITKSSKILITSGVTIIIITIVYQTQKHKKTKNKINKKFIKEGLQNYNKPKEKFTLPTKANPLMNVLLTDINDNPKRPCAAPAFARPVEKKINEKAGNVGPDPRLFVDLGDTISFEQSMRNFYSTANTRVCNDQTAFAKYLYGDMPSCKEGNALQCEKNNQRYNLY